MGGKFGQLALSDILHQESSWSPFPCGHLIFLRFPFTGGTFVSVLCAPAATSVSPSESAGLGFGHSPAAVGGSDAYLEVAPSG